MKNCYLIFCLSFFLLGLSSCKTDIDVTADLQDITVVYSAIDPADSIHYVKINKAFAQDNVSANELAADQTNFNYNDGELTVTVDEYNGNEVVKSHSLIRVENEIPKDPGLFDNSINVLYRFTETTINKSNTYKLNIFNKTLEKEIKSSTEIVKDIIVTNPQVNRKLSFWIGNSSAGTSRDANIDILTGEDIGRVSASLTFNYTDYSTLASGIDPVAKSIEMKLGEKATTTSLGEEQLIFVLPGETFLNNIISNVPSPLEIPSFSHRELNNITLKFLIAGTELNTFIEVSKPSTSLNQDKPPYTNVENGLGIFSSRTTFLWESTLSTANGQVNISPDTIRKLASLGLGFCFGSSSTSGYECNQL